MTTNLSKGAWIVISAIALIILIALVARNCQPEVVVTKPVDSVFYWRDKFNNEHASLKANEIAYSYKEQKLLDSIAKVHNTKVKYIKEVVTVTEKGEVRIVNTETPIIKYVDSNNCPRILYQGFENPYYLVEAQLDVKGDSSFVRLETIDTLSVVWHETKEGGLFKRKTFLQLDVTNANPYNHITGLQAYRIPAPKPKKFGLGIQVGYGFSNGLQPQAYIGVGVSYNVIRF